MKIIVLLFTTFYFLFHLSAHAQSQEATYFDVRWKAGTEKTIYQIDSTVVYHGDSIFMQTGTKTQYNFKVESLKDTVYEVRFKQMILDDDVQIGSEMFDANELQQLLQDLMAKLQRKMIGYEYSFLVDQNTALAFAVKNETELTTLMEEMVVILLNQFMDASKTEIDKSKRDNIHIKIKEFMQSQMPAAMQTVMNSFNYIFQVYDFPYVLGETYITETEVYDVDQVSNGDFENSATLIVNSYKKGNTLSIDYEYDYNKEKAYQDHIVAQGRADQVPFDQFEIKENVKSTFDLNSSWLVKSTSNVNVIMGVMKVDQSTYIQIK